MKWRIGDVTVTKIVELEVTGGSRFILPQATYEAVLPISWLQPHFADERGRLKMSIHALVVETPERRMIVDTCLGNDKQGRRIPGWNNLQGPFLADLAAAGFPRESIDTVLCTHLHVDHVGWNTMLADGPNGTRTWVPTFPNARYLMGRAEFAHWRATREREDMNAVFADSVAPIHEAGLADLVETDHRVCDEISLVPTVGHTPGHVSVRIDSTRRGGADHRRLHAPPLPDRAARLVLGGRQRPRRGAPHPRAYARRIVRQAGPGDRHAFRRRDGRSYRPRRRRVPAGV